MSTRTQSFVLMLFGITLLRLGASDLLLRFVRASARPWVLIAGAVILLLGLWSLVAASRQDNDQSDHGAGTDEHGHGPSSRVAWLVVLPVIAVLVIGPPALGQYTANRRDAVADVDASKSYGQLPAGTNVVTMRVFDFALRAVGAGRRTLSGRTVALTGFVARGDKGGFILARLIITCCAADASPIGVAVRTSHPAPAAGTWVEVTGTYAGQEPSDTNVPLLAAVQVRPVKAPAEPYD